jgi:hypothetical protein
MCAKGTSFSSDATFKVDGYEFVDQVVEGTNNETTLGEKIETCAGFRGEGVGGIKTEIVAGAEIGFVGGLKYDWNLGSKYDFSFGYKFGRSPLGTVEAVGDFFHWNNSHTMTVGTSFFVGAGGTATIHAGTIAFSGSTEVGLTSDTTALILQPNCFQLSLSGGPTALFGLFVNQTQLLALHPTAVSVGTVESYLLANSTGITLNGPTTNINGALINLGQPVVTNASFAAQLAIAQLAAASIAAAEAVEELEVEAAEAAFGTFPVP